MFRYRILSGEPRALARLFLAVAAALAATTASGATQPSAPPSYVTGGVGLDQSQSMLRERDRYPLAVEIYARQGNHDVYTAGADVTLFDARGRPVLHTNADGPFLFADVAPGRYDVQVDRAGETKRKAVVVHDGQTSRAVFVFDQRS